MNHSIISDVVNIGVGNSIRYFIGRIGISGNFSNIKIRCYGSAQERVKPFSIYPIDFNFESNEININPLHIIAHPQPDIRIEQGVYESEIYTVYGEQEYKLEKTICDYIVIIGYARSLISHTVAPVAFFVVEWS